MIEIRDKGKCCGCGACYNICPKNAVIMVEDEEGFRYPKVDKEKCINCGLCKKVCPCSNEYKNKKILEETIAYGGWNKNEDIRAISTSGGVFTAIAEKIINMNGIVCGAVYDENLNVVHTIVDNTQDLRRMNGSKYVQSNIKENYKKVKEYLEQGRKVLFSGTPCQVSGLNTYLIKEYQNLYTCDIVCHGVPSTKVFNKLKEELRKDNSSDIKSINFRDKSSGWQEYSFSVDFENNKKYIKKANEVAYMKFFLSDIDLRPSCSQCNFAKLPRYCDFTLGDFWGVNNCYPELNKDNKGTSLILVHTEKGKKFLENLEDIYIQKCDLEKAIKGNPSILEHKPASKNRKLFFENLDKLNLDTLNKKFIPKSGFLKKIKSKLRNFIKNKKWR